MSDHREGVPSRIEKIGEKPKMVRVTFTKPGVFAFYCSKKILFFKSHREAGMEGVIEVKDLVSIDDTP